MTKPKKRIQTPAASKDSPAQDMSDNTCDIEEASADASPVHISHPYPRRSPPRELAAELQQPGMLTRPDWVTGFEAAIKHDIAQQLDGVKAGQQATNAQLASFLDQHQQLEAEVVALSHRVRNLEQPQPPGPHVAAQWFPNMAGIDDATLPAPPVTSASQSRQDVRPKRGRPVDKDFLFPEGEYAGQWTSGPPPNQGGQRHLHRAPLYHDQPHPFQDSPRPIYRNVGLEKFDGKMDEWENWAHQFRVFTQLYNWSQNEQLVHLVSSLRGPALTAHRSFSAAECATVEACMHALDMRYGSKRPLTIASLRADLSVAKQEEGEGVDTFGDRIVGLTHRAYPGMAPDWIQGLSVPAFLKGLKDKVSGQEAMKFGKPQTVTDAVEQVMHLQCTARTFGGHRSVTNRHVVFDDDVQETMPQTTTNIDRVVDGVVRQLKQVGLSPNDTHRSDACFTCGGAGHHSRDCATKRRRSPSPLTCYECGGLGHLSRECSNTLERRRGTVKPSRRHRRRRSTSSSDSVSSSSQEDTHQHHRGRRDKPRRHRRSNHDGDADNNHRYGRHTGPASFAHSTPKGTRDLAHGRHRSQTITHEGGHSRSPSPSRDYSARHNRSPSPRRDLSASPTRKADGMHRPSLN